MDVICPRHRPIYGARQGDLFLLDLDSEAFTVGNDLVLLYGPANEDESWLGTYRVITKLVFAADSLQNMMSQMIFGEPRDIGIKKTQAFLDAHSQLHDVRCCFVCARSVKHETHFWPWPSKLRRTPGFVENLAAFKS